MRFFLLRSGFMHAVLTTWNRVTAAGLVESCIMSPAGTHRYSRGIENENQKAAWPVREQHRRRPQHRPVHTKSHSSHAYRHTSSCSKSRMTHAATSGKNTLSGEFTGSSNTRNPPKLERKTENSSMDSVRVHLTWLVKYILFIKRKKEETLPVLPVIRFFCLFKTDE